MFSVYERPRLGRALGQTPQYWLNLQTTYDLKMAQIEMRDSLKQVKVLGATLNRWCQFSDDTKSVFKN